MPVPATVDIHPDSAGEIADEGFDSFTVETYMNHFQHSSFLPNIPE